MSQVKVHACGGAAVFLFFLKWAHGLFVRLQIHRRADVIKMNELVSEIEFENLPNLLCETAHSAIAEKI